MNVFSGKSALLDFYNPEKNPPLPLVELPDHPFVDDNVRIYAKMLTLLPAGNVKSLPALNMLMRASECGHVNDSTKRVVEYSSGNTAISLGIVSRIMGGPQVGAYISNKTSSQKMDLLRFFGLDLTLFGGPAQVEPADVNGGIFAAIQDGMKPGWYNPGQYSSPQNSEAHVRWTGPQLHAQLPKVRVFAAAVGTSGTMTGTGSYLKTVKPDIVNLGVFTAPGDRVPGPRPIDLVQTIDLPWQEVIDAAEHVSSYDSYRISMDLCRQGLLVGPSSGLSLQGLYQYLDKAKQSGELDSLRAEDGSVYCTFICCDQPYQYISDYFTKLGDDSFPPIHNTELLTSDLYPYGVDWIVSPQAAFRILYPAHGLQTPPAEPTELDDDLRVIREPPAQSHATVIDLRSATDFSKAHIAGTRSIEIHCEGMQNPFKCPKTLAGLWNTLNEVLIPEAKGLCHKSVLLVSYTEEVAYVGCSVLRKAGINTFALGGGFENWEAAGLDTVGC
ncbi:tryptophan synthase beta subunit-like PLP-dependent enzyme [Ceratobasidium sp. AG-I]|nr:tryptophan synthase beta subunit-like PLP-dependent enzyme [Ceratobasidium sp. AG-I]